MSRAPRTRDTQSFPRTEPFLRNTNVSLNTLCKRIADHHVTVYCYVIATIKNHHGYFVQTGSAPNFQGGMITLCTCKHLMRTFLEPDAWKGTWIAGFTTMTAGQGGNALVYLMEITRAFGSHYHLWYAATIPRRTKWAKAAHRHRFGDLYKPIDDAVDPFDWCSYIPPRPDHVHFQDDAWHDDIRYMSRRGRTPALLTGNPQQSYVWVQPLLYTGFRLGRGQKKCSLGTLLRTLSPGKRL